jgi:benzoyl-CoA reductase subunit A
VVFAKSEASGLLRSGWPKNKVLAAYCSAMAHRVVTLLEQVGIEPSREVIKDSFELGTLLVV